MLRSFLVTDTTQQPHPPSRHITFVPTSYIKKHYQWQILGRGPANPLFVDKNEAQRAKKTFLYTAPSPPPPLSPGLPPWSPLAWVSSSFTQDIGQFYSPWMKLYKSSYYFIKVNYHRKVDMKQVDSKTFLRYTFIIKNLTNFHRKVD